MKSQSALKSPRYSYIGENEQGEIELFDSFHRIPIKVHVLRVIFQDRYIAQLSSKDAMIIGMIANDFQTKQAECLIHSL